MSEIKEVYTDGLETIHMINTTVRLDFFTLQPPQDQGNPIPKTCERIIMPVQAIPDMQSAIQKIVDKLIKDGIILSKPQITNQWDIQK